MGEVAREATMTRAEIERRARETDRGHKSLWLHSEVVDFALAIHDAALDEALKHVDATSEGPDCLLVVVDKIRASKVKPNGQ